MRAKNAFDGIFRAGFAPMGQTAPAAGAKATTAAQAPKAKAGPPALATLLKNLAELQGSVQTMLTDTLLYDRRGLPEYRRMSSDILSARQLLNAHQAMNPAEQTRVRSMVGDMLERLSEDAESAAARFARM